MSTNEKAIENLQEAFRAAVANGEQDAIDRAAEAGVEVSDRGKVRTRTVDTLFAEAVAEASTKGDLSGVQTAQKVRDAILTKAAEASTSSTTTGPDYEALTTARLHTVQAIAALIVADAEENLGDDHEVGHVLDALQGIANGTEADVDALDKVWKQAFRGRPVDVTKVPGGRGGPRATKERATVADGPIEYTTGDTTYEAALEDGTVVAVKRTLLHDGGRVEKGEPIGTGTPSGAIRALTGQSVNGWIAWTRDGQDLDSLA